MEIYEKMQKKNFNNINLKDIKVLFLDFDGVLTNNKVLVLENGKEAVICSRFDGIGINNLRKIGVETIIISTETNSVVSERAKKLKVRCYQSVENKKEKVHELLCELKLSQKQAVFLGNDVNDLGGR